MTVFDVRGHGRQRGHKEIYRGQEYVVDLLPKIKVGCVVPGQRVDEIVATIVEAVRAGLIGDGKIFVSDLPLALQIRSGRSLAEAS